MSFSAGAAQGVATLINDTPYPPLFLMLFGFIVSLFAFR